ncbi:HlyD family efflux transporter periplasmic adaptor subunit [Paenalcaligenes sp. Me131]|uniref:HlyD family secretion protein n=1 Tax=Paenalcaligenes sp. Me131 TaxID=3392636 RepID=UPI003D275C0C
MTTKPSSQRKRLLTSITTIFVLIGIAYAVWALFLAGNTESTEDAYVHGNMVQISARQTGTVQAILADDTEMVQQGSPLIELDPTDVNIAMQQAEAQLAQSVRKTRTLFAQNDALEAEVQVQEAEARQAKVTLEKAESDLRRRQSLRKIGGVSGEEILHAEATVKTARSALNKTEAAIQAAKARLNTNLALTAGTTVENHPDVQLAADHYRNAWLATTRTRVDAPTSGMVAQRSVQVGQHVAAGTTLMSVVPLDQFWVEANFKENQLKDMRAGQKVTLHADFYGTNVEYHGIVENLAAGTGSAFSLLPAQNASGNWIKVVQRLPVRIRLDPKELQEHPLRIGLSMQVTVDLDSEPEALNGGPAHLSTDIFQQNDDAVNQRIADITQANLAS